MMGVQTDIQQEATIQKTQKTPEKVTFESLALGKPLLDAIHELGFEHATEVQQKAIPAVMAGKDLLVSSQTGSGKTAAFMLPTLQRLFIDEPVERSFSKVSSPQILVLCPTRELVTQVTQDTIKFVRFLRDTRIASVIGGMPFPKQIKQLHNAKVVIATPGRLLDLVNRRKIRLDKVRALIVDEADRMLDLGFIDDLTTIHENCQLREQSLMFSATFEGRLVDLAKQMTDDDSVRIEIGTQHATNKNIAQKLHWVDGFGHKKKLLDHWLNVPELNQAVVFASTKRDTDMLAEELTEAGRSVVALHGDMPQSVRNRRIRQLREGRADILVATDVAARGLDVPNISHVINFGLPMRNEDYVHRIGRTGRAGRSGTAVTLAAFSESRKIRDLERYLKEKLEVDTVEGLEPRDKPKPQNKNRKGRGRSGGYAGKGKFSGKGNGAGRKFTKGGKTGGQKFGQKSEGGNKKPFGSQERAASSKGNFSRDRHGDVNGNVAAKKGDGKRISGKFRAKSGASQGKARSFQR